MDEENIVSKDDKNIANNRSNEEAQNNNEVTRNKRMKIQNGSEESSTSSNNTEKDNASTSSDSGFPKTTSIKNRNYRKSHGDESSANENESGEEEGLNTLDSNTEDDELDELSRSPTGSSPTVIDGTDSDDDDDDEEEEQKQEGEKRKQEEEDPAVLKKPKPKPKWFMVPELISRQIGYSSKLQNVDLFQKRCTGSLYSVQRLELMYKLEEHLGCVNCLNFHPTGSYLISGSDDLHIILWDWKIGKFVLKYDTKHHGNVFQSKFLHLSGDMHIASCARDGQVRIARVSTEGGVRENRKLGSHKAPCHKLAVLPDQPHIILSAGEDGAVLSHDVRKTKPENVVTVKNDDREIALYSIHANPIKTHEFCVGGKDDTVRVYDTRKGNTPLSLHSPFKKDQPSYYMGLHLTCAVYNYNGSEILASYNDADIYLFDVNAPQGNFIHKYEGHRNGATIKGVNFFGPKSEYIVSGSDCGNVFYWDKNTEAIVQCMLADDNGVVNCLEPHPHLPFICTSGLDWDVKVWVPSCEEDPALKNLGETIKNNNKSRFSSASNLYDAPMLWMLWRHLRSAGDIRRELVTADSSTDSPSDEDDDDDLGELHVASECTTS